MAYFHCLIGGGSSGGGYELTVTCDADFAGTTITATDGVTTLTQTCPSASPYEVVFEIPNGGDWTISGIISGQTYSASIDIPDSLELHSTPEGSTVLPTDDIQTWLACAGITDKSYTTLNEVLADSTTLLALMSNNNAVDYLVRSTSWAGNANDLIPAMTSTTTPSGVVTSVSQYSNDYADWKAFNGSVSNNGWLPNSSATVGNAWIQYEFPNAVRINKLAILQYFNGSTWSYTIKRTVKIEGSNDGTNFTPLANNLESTYTWNEWAYHIFNNNTSYKYYKINITAVEGTISGAGLTSGSGIKLQLYNEGLTTDSTAMTDIGANNYCANTLLSDSTWLNAVCNSTYFESVLNVKVPVMTSNTTPSGVCDRSSAYNAGAEAWKIFDGIKTNNSYWESGLNAITNEWVSYEFTAVASIYKVMIMPLGSQYSPKNAKIQAYVNNGWIDAKSIVCTDSLAEQYFIIDTHLNSNKWRIFCIDNYGKNHVDIVEAQFYGREDV